jgi:hypothetical protein
MRYVVQKRRSSSLERGGRFPAFLGALLDVAPAARRLAGVGPVRLASILASADLPVKAKPCGRRLGGGLDRKATKRFVWVEPGGAGRTDQEA